MSAISARFASDAQKDANNANRESALQNSATQRALFDLSRGSAGSAFFPLYAKDSGGELFEPQFWDTALKTFNSIDQLSAEDMQAINKALIAKYGSAQAAADAVGKGIFDGTMDSETLAELQPVLDARTNLADAQAEAGNEALAETVNRITARQKQNGWQGANDNFLTFAATLDNRTRQAQIRGGAAFENAGDTLRTKKENRAIKLGNIDMPYKLTRQAIDLENLPANTALDQKQRMASYLKSLFNIGPGQSGYTPLPSVQPNANLGQIISGGLGGVARDLGNYYGNRSMAREMNAGQYANGFSNLGIQAPSNFTSLTPAQQQSYFNTAYQNRGVDSNLYDTGWASPQYSSGSDFPVY